jgi:hypothetical protein
MVYKPYVIMSPPFEVTSGGVRVMYGLYGWLLAKGQIAYMNEKPTSGEFIAIYPEIQRGNPAKASKVVRYILSTPGLIPALYDNGIVAHGPDTKEIKETSDYIYVFSKIYDTFNSDDNHILFLPIINLHLFKDQKKKRTKTCYMIGKGFNKRCHPDGSIELTRQFSQDQQVLADLLNECHTFYCYDNLSAMMEVARLCGCAVKYYGDYSEEELKKYEPGLNGVSLGKEEVKLDVEEFRSHYTDLGRIFNERLDKFIVETQL